jgi:hypothetical protein
MQKILLVLLVLIVIVIAFFILQSRKHYTGAGATKSETFAVQELERLTSKKFPTAHPKWLRWRNPFTGATSTLELDGYNKDIALEFSGPLHTKWHPAAETYKSYYTRILKDMAKKELCKAHGVCLIVLDMSLPRRHYRDYFASRLFDCGKGLRPDNYIAEQVATPFRNPHLENGFPPV